MHGSHYMRYISQGTVLITCGMYHKAWFSLYVAYITMHGSHYMWCISQYTGFITCVIYHNAVYITIENICNEIMEFQRTGRYDLMYMKTKN